MTAVYTVTVAGRNPVGICATEADAEQLAARYLNMCWPAASPTPRETYQIANRSERWHDIPSGHYSAGELLPVKVERVELWDPSQTWPAAS